ncbi:MAG: hypothetical protein U5K43_05045 [Halofilum sp. (in: g-proteobacteria)]|nr:hypothetical protein [Halofilum sp. (in: g-proteobacteria)]
MTSDSSAPARLRILRVALLACFVLLAYLPSFGVPFVFDDIPNIVLNRQRPTRQLALPWANRWTRAVARDRPVAMFTFALNYLWGGLDRYLVPSGQSAAARRQRGSCCSSCSGSSPVHPGRRILGAWASTVAFSGALIWALHPVNTQAVTYIVQRMASLAALFYLAGHARLRALA